MTVKKQKKEGLGHSSYFRFRGEIRRVTACEAVSLRAVLAVRRVAVMHYLTVILVALTAAPLLSHGVPLTKPGPVTTNPQRWSMIANGVQRLSATLECTACKLAVKTLQQLFSQNATEDAIVKAVVELCVVLKVEDENVCSLVVPEFKVLRCARVCCTVCFCYYNSCSVQSEVLYVFAHVALDPEEVCGVLLGPSCAKPYNPKNQTWNITFPSTPKPPVSPLTPPNVSNTQGYVHVVVVVALIILSFVEMGIILVKTNQK